MASGRTTRKKHKGEEKQFFSLHFFKPGYGKRPDNMSSVIRFRLPWALGTQHLVNILNSSYFFILVHLSSFKFGWNPSESCVLSFRLSIFSSFCPDLSLIVHLRISDTPADNPCSVAAPAQEQFLPTFQIILQSDVVQFYL